MSDPRRLLDDESASAELRSLLESARREDEPSADRIAALSTQLGPLIAPLAPPPAPVPVSVPAATGTAMLVAKLGGALVAAAIVAGGVWFAYDRSGAAPAESPPAPVRQPPPDAPPPEPASEITPDAPLPEPPPPAPPTPVPVDANAEAALVRAAQAALLHDDAASALALTRQHATRFASGAHAEERDRIAIEALVGLGRLGEARDKAHKFFTQYPRSIYRPRIEALLP